MCCPDGTSWRLPGRHIFIKLGPAESTDSFLLTLLTGIHAGDCRLHEFFISFNMILCVVLSVTSVLPIVQENLPNSGLLQGGNSIQ